MRQTTIAESLNLARIMVRVDFAAFMEAFNAWAATCVPAPTDASRVQVPLDGKSIKASLCDYDQSYQDFISVVSAFSVEQGVGRRLLGRCENGLRCWRV
ncbi:MAG: hypothetical protein VKJ24_20675 [Synechococcales bacterium]|nr:hypothetical protein [Synechococcales bacterium]